MSLQLIKLQRKFNLKDDGVLGRITLKRLSEELSLTKEETAHLLGQMSHETGYFNYDEENLNYSKNNLLKTFPKYFPTEDSTKGYVNNPVKIGSKVYANRMGNGPEESQEGFKYRGRGAIQLTGKDNYKAFSVYIKEDCVSNPDLVSQKYFLESALFFFTKNNLWKFCTKVDDKSIERLTKKINGGLNGIEERKSLTKKYYSLLIS